MLSNAYFLAKFRFDTAENEPAKNLQNLPILRDHRSDEVRAPVGDGEEREVGGLLALGDEQREEGAEERLHVAEDEQAKKIHDVVAQHAVHGVQGRYCTYVCSNFFSNIRLIF